jgi:hypothetical protein
LNRLAFSISITIAFIATPIAARAGHLGSVLKLSALQVKALFVTYEMLAARERAAMPGSLRSVAIAYGAWTSGKVTGPDPSALSSNAFRVEERFAGEDPRCSHLVVYVPLAVAPPLPGPVSCPNTINYCVDSQKGTVVRAINIC